MHFKVCLPHGLKVLLCLWGPEEVGQMVPMKTGCFLGPFSTEQCGFQQFGLSALPAASITNITV